MKDRTKVTEFQSRVYELISDIPAGRVSTYGGVASVLNSSARAVGGALRRNPYAPTVPCHRVVMSDLSIGGFGGSFGDCPNTRRKRKMLEKEGVRFVDDKVDGNAYLHVFQNPSEGKASRVLIESKARDSTAKRPLAAGMYGGGETEFKRARKPS
ncbi:unnamed protein product [Ascophyllum nodosum]